MVESHDCATAVRWLGCPCSCHAGSIMEDHQCPCGDTNGTGLRFTGLSQVCCRHCGPYSRVPVDTLKAWLDAAEALREGIRIWRDPKTKTYDCTIAGGGPIINVYMAPTRLAAIAEALCKATENHPDGESDANGQ